MKIILDGEEISYNPGIETTIAAKLKNENLVIRSIKVGGVDLVNATLDEALAKPMVSWREPPLAGRRSVSSATAVGEPMRFSITLTFTA